MFFVFLSFPSQLTLSTRESESRECSLQRHFWTFGLPIHTLLLYPALDAPQQQYHTGYKNYRHNDQRAERI
jgi:hypothetical protein